MQKGEPSMFFEIIVTILSIAFLIFIALSIPVLLQVRRTARSMAHTLHMLDNSLPAILMNLEETTAHLSQTARTVNERVGTLSAVFVHFQTLLGIGSGAENDLFEAEGFSFYKILKIATGMVTGLNLVSNIFSAFAKKKNS
jgi:hypothetical protein